MPDTRMPHCLYAWQHREQMFAVGHFPILTNSPTLQIFCNIDLYTHINISSMNASSFVYIDVVIICTMMSFYQQILHSFSYYNVLCIGNLTYAGHFAVCPSTLLQFIGNYIVIGLLYNTNGLACLCILVLDKQQKSLSPIIYDYLWVTTTQEM